MQTPSKSQSEVVKLLFICKGKKRKNKKANLYDFTLPSKFVSSEKLLDEREKEDKQVTGNNQFTYFPRLHLFCPSPKSNVRIICAGAISLLLFHCWDKRGPSTVFPLFNPVLIYFSDQFIIFFQQQLGLLQADWLNVKSSMSLSYGITDNAHFKFFTESNTIPADRCPFLVGLSSLQIVKERYPFFSSTY